MLMWGKARRGNRIRSVREEMSVAGLAVHAQLSKKDCGVAVYLTVFVLSTVL